MGRLTWGELGTRPALFPAASLLAGAGLGFATLGPPFLFLGLALALLFGALFFRKSAGGHLALLAAVACLGGGLASWQARASDPPRAAPFRARLEGKIAQIAPGDGYTRVDLKVSSVDGHPARFGARLYARGKLPPLTAGQRVAVPVRLKPLAPPSNPGQADFTTPALHQGRRYSGGFEGDRLVPLSAPSALGLWLLHTREALATRVNRLSPDPKAAAFVLTLAAGLRANLGDTLEAEFSASGLAHVLSVSGLHVALLACIIFWLLRRMLVWVAPLARGFDVRRLAAPLAIPPMWAYVVFTGNQPPAVRSALMASFMFGALFLWRRSDALNALCWAAFVLVLLQPSAVENLSLRLSFTAVAALIFLTPALRPLFPRMPPPHRVKTRLGRWLSGAGETAIQTACASLAVILASAPWVASAFHRISLAGLVSNIVCLPLCGLLTLTSAGGAALFIVWAPLATPMLWAGCELARVLLWLVAHFAALPGSTVAAPGFPWGWACLYWAGLALFALAKGRLRWASLLAPLALAFVFCGPLWGSRPGLTVTFLSVGHGDAIVLQSEGHTALVDGGGVPHGADTGRKYVLPFLREQGVRHLDLVVLSHPHPDHALGLISTLKALRTDRLWISGGEGDGPLTRAVVAAAKGAQVSRVAAGWPTFRLGEAEIQVIGPPRHSLLLEDVNDKSVVLLVRHRKVSFLLTGDIEAAAEAALKVGPVTVVKAPHHGSSTSSSEPFVKRTRPKVVVFSVGRHDRFHAPSAEVVSRWRAVGAAPFRTDLDGAVWIHSDGDAISVHTFLPHARPPAHGLPGTTLVASLSRR